MGTGADNHTTPPASAIVLAGGQSRRLGQDKSLLVLQGQPLLARALDRLADLTDDLIVVTADPSRYAHLRLPGRFVADERPGVGALMGIYSGLRAARHQVALVLACDMPFVNLPLVRYQLSLAPSYDAVVPHFGDESEPLHAVYGRSCLPGIGRVLAQGERRIIAFFDQVRVRYVSRAEIDRFDPEHRSFMNVNTPEDWEWVQAVAASASG